MLNPKALVRQLQNPDWWRTQSKRFFFFQKFIIGNQDANISLHLPLCDFVQEDPPWERPVSPLRSRRIEKLILIPRGHLKTSVVTISYPIWRLIHWDYTRRPFRVLIGNAEFEKAIDFLREIRGHILHNEFLRGLYPDFFAEADSKSKAVFKDRLIRIRKDAHYFSIEASSYNQGKSGKHYDLIILDDMVNEKNFTSEAEMRKLWTWFKNVYSLGEMDSEIIVIGTRYSYSDLYERILTDEGFSSFKVFFRQVWKTDENGERILDENGEPIPIFPEKFTNADIYALQERQKIFFSAQYLNQPVSLDYAAVKPEHIQYYDQLPDTQLAYYMAVDPARTSSKTADYSAIVVGAMDNAGKLYVVRALQGRWNISEFLERVFNMAQLFSPVRIGIETENYEILEQIIQEKARERELYFPFVKLKSGGRNKLERIARTLVPWFEQRKVYLHRKQQDLIQQLLQFSPLAPPKHDDLLDALTYLIQIARPPWGSSEPQEVQPKTPAQTLLDLSLRQIQNKRKKSIFDIF